MLQRKSLLTAAVLLATAGAAVYASRPPQGRTVNQFEEVSMTVQVNATDEDIGVMIAMEAAEAFLGLVVYDPFGDVALDVRADNPAGMGLTELAAEASRENIAAGLAAFPEGVYGLTAIGVDGTLFHGRAELSHDLPSRPQLILPGAEGTIASTDELIVAWKPVREAVHFILEVEGPGLNLTLQIPPEITTFAVPANIILPDTSYAVSVGAVNAQGNVVLEEVRIQTMP